MGGQLTSLGVQHPAPGLPNHFWKLSGGCVLSVRHPRLSPRGRIMWIRLSPRLGEEPHSTLVFEFGRFLPSSRQFLFAGIALGQLQLSNSATVRFVSDLCLFFVFFLLLLKKTGHHPLGVSWCGSIKPETSLPHPPPSTIRRAAYAELGPAPPQPNRRSYPSSAEAATFTRQPLPHSGKQRGSVDSLPAYPEVFSFSTPCRLRAGSHWQLLLLNCKLPQPPRQQPPDQENEFPAAAATRCRGDQAGRP